jgi:hypothetical protein
VFRDYHNLKLLASFPAAGYAHALIVILFKTGAKICVSLLSAGFPD